MKFFTKIFFLNIIALFLFFTYSQLEMQAKEPMQVGMMFSTNIMTGPSELTSAPTVGQFGFDNVPYRVNSSGFGATAQFGVLAKMPLSPSTKFVFLFNYTSWTSNTPLTYNAQTTTYNINLSSTTVGTTPVTIGSNKSNLSLVQFGAGFSFDIIKLHLTKKMPLNIFIQPEIDANIFGASGSVNYSMPSNTPTSLSSLNAYTIPTNDSAYIMDGANSSSYSSTAFRLGAGLTVGAEVKIIKQLSAEFGFRFQMPNLILRQDAPNAIANEAGSTSEKLISVFGIQLGVLYNL